MRKVILETVKREDVDGSERERLSRVLGVNGKSEVVTREEEGRQEKETEEARNEGEGNSGGESGEGEVRKDE